MSSDANWYFNGIILMENLGESEGDRESENSLKIVKERFSYIADI